MANLSSLKHRTFDGSGDAKAFLTKVELAASLKGCTEEELAAAVVGGLDGSALDLDMRFISDDDKKKSPARIKEELLRRVDSSSLV